MSSQDQANKGGRPEETESMLLTSGRLDRISTEVGLPTIGRRGTAGRTSLDSEWRCRGLVGACSL